MQNDNDSNVFDLAVRVFPERVHAGRNGGRRVWKPAARPEAVFVFDTETRVDAPQRLTFGSYRFIVSERCLEEGLFYADDVTEDERRTLEAYAETHRAETVPEGNAKLKLLCLAEFLDRLYRAAFKGRCLLVGFNLPFDVSRVANDFSEARGRFAGGFSFELWTYKDKDGNKLQNPHRPRIAIKHIDSKRALKGFTGCHKPDRVDLIPEGSTTGEPEPGFRFRGHFLDCRTLAFALTDEADTLEKACKKFGVEHGKHPVVRHGEITPEYIDYNWRDVLATAELAVKLLDEYEKHPIALQATKAYSSASIGKAYLRAMGIPPILERQPDFSRTYLGYAATAFYGGRASSHVRKEPVPVSYVDFLSMYPTVNSNMNLWRFVIARRINVVEHCEDKIQAFLENVSAQDLFRPETWKHLTAFVKIIPDRDILPCRARYNQGSNDWQVAVNYLDGMAENQHHALWYSLPDVVASVILTGKVPKILDAFRIVPVGILSGLKATWLRGDVKVDPRRHDLFKVAVEERQRLKRNDDASDPERKRLEKSLKVLALAASYGIYAEMNRQESDDEVDLICYGLDPEPYHCRVKNPDIPGEYCFPPLASLITGGARLMLALLELCVSDNGGTYAMEDTDSMAIVSTERGGLVPCRGGSYRTAAGQEAIKAISWAQVDQIIHRFESLNPYDRDAVPGSILKLEDDNRDPETNQRRQIYCFGVSAKRYALFLKDQKGKPALLRKGINNNEDRWSQHGLGHLLNPIDPESDDRDWIAQIWLDALSRPCAQNVSLPFGNLPAIGRISIASPEMMKVFAKLNDGKDYSERIKPFNFLVTCHVRRLGHPNGADPERFNLVAPYQSDLTQCLKTEWIDESTGNTHRITTTTDYASWAFVPVKTYDDIAREYRYHPEAKYATADGRACGKPTIGLLKRRHICIGAEIKYIGKESNKLGEVLTGQIHSAQKVYTEYPDPRRDEWQLKILPALRKVLFADLLELSGMSRSQLFEVLAGRSRPHPRNQQRLTEIVRRLGLI
jgi:hypothetical protein